MFVWFTKVDAKRYRITIDRQHGPPLLPRFAPGYDDLMPHDLAHYVVEEYFRIGLGVWGQLAAGGGGIFTPAPEDRSLRYQRRVERIGTVGRSDMARSEDLVVLTVDTWQRSTGRINGQTRHVDHDLDEETLAGAVRRMGQVSEQWRALARGDSLSFTWPAELTFNAATSARGRRHRNSVSSRN
ncbi:MAG TPA: hypothetical protein PLZ93_19130 [Nocardioides sp.]|uniref:hypothetical protein n=1 Tax=uncultured Nocardioides sp. TaxID=198441 RepID=UPI000EE4DDC9|nr:hypothetical protein [uncultured Nocardioides sp.]HCB05370.1 hypothetical protein [Nocardioides sp.]HRD59913.1 hypothetical protein [Nocardioides sp.]HRI97742.1 hypothetical protein [Nocardioides sp.]HRK48748.1 hypothetical protein [Nocardioides sp.]